MMYFVSTPENYEILHDKKLFSFSISTLKTGSEATKYGNTYIKVFQVFKKIKELSSLIL